MTANNKYNQALEHIRQNSVWLKARFARLAIVLGLAAYRHPLG